MGNSIEFHCHSYQSESGKWEGYVIMKATGFEDLFLKSGYRFDTESQADEWMMATVDEAIGHAKDLGLDLDLVSKEKVELQ